MDPASIVHRALLFGADLVNRSSVFATIVLGALAACGGPAGAVAGGADPASAPAAVADELLAIDRAFAAASERTDVAAGLAPMLAEDVVMPVPGGFAVGRDSVLAAIRAAPPNQSARLGWTPVRVGISADGRHGFTLGYFTLRGADGSSTTGKYLTYWVKGAEGWRAAVLRRRRADGTPALTELPPALPPRGVAPSNDSAAIGRYRQSLDTAERAFSRDAQRIGLRAPRSPVTAARMR